MKPSRLMSCKAGLTAVARAAGVRAGGRSSVPNCAVKTARIWAARPDNSRGGPTVSNGTRWGGIDLHRNRSHVAVIDEQGELTLSRRIVNDRDTFLELLG